MVRLYLTQAPTAPLLSRSLSCVVYSDHLQFPARCAAASLLLRPSDAKSGRCGGTTRRMWNASMSKHRLCRLGGGRSGNEPIFALTCYTDLRSAAVTNRAVDSAQGPLLTSFS